MRRKMIQLLTYIVILVISWAGAAYAEDLLRIEINKDGVYYINYQSMVEAGIPTNTDPKTIKIFNQGVEIPIYVYGENDTGAINQLIYYIEFYAKGIPRQSEYYDFTNTNIYWLEWWWEKPDTEENDQWFWEKIKGGEAREYSFTLKNIDTASADCAVRVSVHGKTDISILPADHNSRIYLNNHLLNKAGNEWDGMIPKKWEISGIDCSYYDQQ